jgi:hypothetical protein
MTLTSLPPIPFASGHVNVTVALDAIPAAE